MVRAASEEPHPGKSRARLCDGLRDPADADWKNTCLLCTDLPTLENGLARREDRPDGKEAWR